MSGGLIDGVAAPRLVLVGLGPHARRIYMHSFRKYQLQPDLVVELESERARVEAYFAAAGYRPELIFVPDAARDAKSLDPATARSLLVRMSELGVTHAVISTEPKAHFAYVDFFLTHHINVLTDKPITAPVAVSTDERRSALIESEFNLLNDRYESARAVADVTCQVQCQRRWHEGYRHARGLVEQCVRDYGVPITSIDVYHCDGMWNMPDEFFLRENHPYKYGYGKLFHSGYHFIDLMCWFHSVNAALPGKLPDSAEVYAAAVRPSDFFTMINQDDYRRLLGTDRFASHLDEEHVGRAEQFGEIDLHALVQFRRGARTVTTASLNLLQNGFSRRAWDFLPADAYKGNGRVRHERVNIQVGPLLNLQVHSYQSAEIKDRGIESDDGVGTMEHFEIYVFRNTEIIGGVPFERIPLKELIKPADGDGFIGFNEQARERSLMHFLASRDDQSSDLTEHDVPVKVMANVYSSLSRRSAGRSPVVEFAI